MLVISFCRASSKLGTSIKFPKSNSTLALFFQDLTVVAVPSYHELPDAQLPATKATGVRGKISGKTSTTPATFAYHSTSKPLYIPAIFQALEGYFRNEHFSGQHGVLEPRMWS